MIVVLPSQRLVLVIQKVNKAAAICNFHQVWSFNKAWLDKNGKRMTWVDWFVTWSQSLQINKLHNSAVLVYVSTFVSFWIFLNFVKRIYGQLIGFGSVHPWFHRNSCAFFVKSSSEASLFLWLSIYLFHEIHKKNDHECLTKKSKHM